MHLEVLHFALVLLCLLQGRKCSEIAALPGTSVTDLAMRSGVGHMPPASYTGTMVRVLRPLPCESIKLLVFDLDGTLIDSARDLCNSVNAALEHMSRPPLDDAIIASFVGNGAPMLVRRSLAVENGVAPDEVHDEELATAYTFFLEHYREHKLDFTYA